MPSVKLKQPTTIEALKDLLQSRLSDRCSFELKQDRLRLVESPAKGCSVALRTKNGEPVCYVMGFMPSMALRAGLLVGVMLVFSVVISLILGEFNILLGGAIPFIIVYLAMDVPSRDLVAEVTAIISSDLAQTAPPQPRSPRTRPMAGIAVAVVVVVATLAVINWPASKPAVRPEATALETPVREQVPLRDDLAPFNAATDDRPREYSMAAGIRGRIAFLHPNLKPGEIIPKDTVILRIDTGDLTDSLQRAEQALWALQSDLAVLEARAAAAETEYSILQKSLNEQPGAEKRSEIERQHLLIRRAALERVQEQLDAIADRRALVTSRIADLQRQRQVLDADLGRAEISMPVDVEINVVHVKPDEFIHAGLVLFEATEAAE